MVRLGDYVRQGNAAWLDGDIDSSTYSIVQDLCFVDATATMNDNGDICIALSNRSHNKAQNIELDLPEGYAVAEVWSLESKNITAVNTSSNRDVVQSKRVEVTDDTLSLLPCGLKIVRCVKAE
jgi:alpha-L-arabinofuranosidase